MVRERGGGGKREEERELLNTYDPLPQHLSIPIFIPPYAAPPHPPPQLFLPSATIRWFAAWRHTGDATLEEKSVSAVHRG